MGRLIDADELYEQIAKKEELAQQRVLDTPSRMSNGDFNPSAMRYATQLDERTQMKFMIVDAPTIDAVPVKHGHWVKNDEGDYHCSICKAIVESDEKYRHYWGYCYHCGAKMEVKEMME